MCKHFYISVKELVCCLVINIVCDIKMIIKRYIINVEIIIKVRFTSKHI